MDGQRRLVLEPGGTVVSSGRSYWPVRERNRGPRELFPVPTRFGFQQHLVSYSTGPDGVDDGTEGDDVMVRPWALTTAREFVVLEALGTADLVGAWLAAVWLWALAALRLCSRRAGEGRGAPLARRVVAVAALATLMALAVYFFEERWSFRWAMPDLHAEVGERLAVSLPVAMFASLLFPGLLLVTWASARDAGPSAPEPPAQARPPTSLPDPADPV